MTMEMWWLGFYMDRVRLVIFMGVMIPMLIALDRYSGFRETSTLAEDAVDGMVAYGVGFAASALVLLLFDVIDPSMPPREVIGKVALQAVPASFGAVLANSQLAGAIEADKRKRSGRSRGGTERSCSSWWPALCSSPSTSPRLRR